jgi:hypothetical protein
MGKDAPLRGYVYSHPILLGLLADFLAAGLATLAVLSGQLGEPFGAIFAGFLALGAGAVSFQIRRRKKSRIWLYQDRIVWIGTFGRRREAPIESVGRPFQFPDFLTDAAGFCFPTAGGLLYVTQQLEGFGDLVRRLEGAKLGWATRTLPQSRLPWTAPEAYRPGRALRRKVILEFVLSLLGLVLTFGVADGIGMAVCLLFVTVVLATLTLFDFKKYENARVERVGDRLVQFDRWKREVASVRISGLHYVTLQSHAWGESARIEGDVGAITIDSDAEGAMQLIEGAYQIITDRHRLALRRPEPVKGFEPSPEVLEIRR